jgi:poly-D-alanine transfer protein DltD
MEDNEMVTGRLLKVEENINIIKTDMAVVKEKQDAFGKTASRIEEKVNEIFKCLPTKADLHYVEKLEDNIKDKASCSELKTNTDAIKYIVIFALTQAVAIIYMLFKLWTDKL